MILWLFLLSMTPCYASDCARISKADAFRMADFVFLGEVIEVMDTTFSVIVLESYKGTPSDSLVGIINQNVIIPKKGSIWLFYATDLESLVFVADACSGSKSFDTPHGAHDVAYLIPPPPEVLRSPAQLFILEQVLEDKALNELYFEIASLRHLKLQNRIAALEEQSHNLDGQSEQVNEHFVIIVVLIGLLIVLQFFRNFRHIKQEKQN